MMAADERFPMAGATKLRVVIGEDEPGSRARLRQLIARAPDLQLVGECCTGRATLEAVRRERPSLIYLDVRMPDLDGFGVLNALGPLGTSAPLVVFVTAHDHYAVRAFDVSAADYLVKPFDDERFARSLARVRSVWAVRALGRRTPSRIARSDAIGPTGSDAGGRLVVHVGDTIRFLEIGEITRVTAEDCYARIHQGDRTCLVRASLTRLAQRLPPPLFRRVHRSTLVNIDHVVMMAPASHGDQRWVLSDGAEVRVSRRYRPAVHDLGSG
jgi:two-component system, LytTR family, response regulator